MKKVLALILAVVLIVGCAFSVSAAASSQKKIVYVSSQAVPKAAVEYVRKYFSERMPAQDICDQTKLTVDQVKKVRICPPVTVEPFETDSMQRYYFPLIYNEEFVGTIAVYWIERTGYACSINGMDDPFIKALNTLSSSVSAPITLVVAKDGYFALDSKNKATLLQSFIPSSEKELNRQKREIPKMVRPSRTVSLSAATAYSEKISSEQIADEMPVLAVKNETEYINYTSNDGGRLWKRQKPPVYISIANSYYPLKNGKITYTIHNRTGREIGTGSHFTLQKWNGLEWVACPETDELIFNDDELLLSPNSKSKFTASWGRNGIKLEAGKYKIIKELNVNKQKFTCEAVFCLV